MLASARNLNTAWGACDGLPSSLLGGRCLGREPGVRVHTVGDVPVNVAYTIYPWRNPTCHHCMLRIERGERIDLVVDGSMLYVMHQKCREDAVG